MSRFKQKKKKKRHNDDGKIEKRFGVQQQSSFIATGVTYFVVFIYSLAVFHDVFLCAVAASGVFIVVVGKFVHDNDDGYDDDDGQEHRTRTTH